MDKHNFYEYLNKNLLTVISTISENGQPQSAVIGFGQTSDLEIIFATHNSSRKYKNLQSDPHVSFVVGWEHGETMQYEGVARELNAGEKKLVEEGYWRKNPSAKKYDIPDERYFIVKPSWIRHTNLKQDPWKISEIKF